MIRTKLPKVLLVSLLGLLAPWSSPWSSTGSPALLAQEDATDGPTLGDDPGVTSRLELFSLWIEDQMAALGQPGIAISIVYDDEIVWARGFGLADIDEKRPVTADTTFRIGSISKTFTAVAILKLRDAGKLRLDDPISKFIPDLSYGNPFPDAEPITVWHLLTHTSGLPREAALPYWTDRKFPTSEELHRALATQELLFEPGSDYQYSNLGMGLLGEVVAAASGTSYENYLRTAILTPLGTTASYVEPPPASATVARGYLTRPTSQLGQAPPLGPHTDAKGLASAADLSASARDLGRYLSALFPQGERSGILLRPSTLREMFRVHWLYSSWSSGRGLGFSTWKSDRRTLVGHGGWVAGHRASIAFDPKAKIGVAVLTNSDEGGPGSYIDAAFDLVVPAIESAARKRQAAAPEPPDLVAPERYVGSYQNPWGERTQVLVVDGDLVLFDRSIPPTRTPAVSFTRLVPVANEEHAFTVTGGTRRVVFELTDEAMAEGSRVGRIKIGENYLFPADCGEIGPDLRCTWK